ncbi:uncharacterized protein [Rutidosis leptorrhynchoides]|uniref:uncharacterized protein n=1 Tax=Rutidosis leptorrhynchoides TaxID=125765 RepID=UPI003A98F1F8
MNPFMTSKGHGQTAAGREDNAVFFACYFDVYLHVLVPKSQGTSIWSFSDEKQVKVIIYKHEAAKGSLVMYLSSPKVTWIQRLRISLGIARALSYIHCEDGRSYSVIHRNINSSTILLDGKFEPKLSEFEYSVNHSVLRMDDVLFSEAIGTTGYIDPEIVKTGGVTHKSDIYSFGVVLLELLCGRKACLPNEKDNFLVSLAKSKFGKIKFYTLMLPGIIKEVSRRSIDTFSPAVKSCLMDERLQRPNMKYIVQQLEKAMELQLPYESVTRPSLEHLTSQLSHLKFRMDDMSVPRYNGRVKKAKFYDIYRAYKENIEGDETECLKRSTTVFLKRLRPEEDNLEVVFGMRPKQDMLGDELFRTDIEMLATCKHPNIVTLLGFCVEDLEKMFIIEEASKGFLSEYLTNDRDKSILTWEKRLKICLDVAYGLKYLHHDMEDQKVVINGCISSDSIALYENFGAKIVDFGLSIFLPPNQDQDDRCLCAFSGPPHYLDPEYSEMGRLKRESDVYSFGLVLFEILFGQQHYEPIYKTIFNSEDGVANAARRGFLEGTIMDMIDPIIKEEGDDNKESIDTFVKTAYWCLAKTQDERPTMKFVVKELEKAFSFQVSLKYPFLSLINTDSL